MKNYTITVNGVAYDVTVEEGSSNAAAPRVAPKASPAPKAASAPKAQAPKASTGAKGSINITSPMPGKILDVKLSAGDSVKQGQVILILEAMKMENDIVATQDGTIASIEVSVGESVDTGAVLATLN